MDKLKAGDWFSETPDETWGIYSGVTAMTMKIHEVLHHEKSPYQEIFVFRICFGGRSLFLTELSSAPQKTSLLIKK